MKSRAFPAFTYDASAGSNWATRFSFENNRNAGDDWPVETFEFADEDLQRVREDVSASPTPTSCCATSATPITSPSCRASAGLRRWCRWPTGWRCANARRPNVSRTCLPSIAADRLHRVIVDSRLMQATRRCLLLWHRLQEHGGIHNSHAEQTLARERAAWEEREAPGARGADSGLRVQHAGFETVSEASGRRRARAPTDAAAAAAPPPSDEAWIETTRCSSCNECQNINDKLFGYDENKQAYIKDLSAGTYKDLIEAAEACQVAIIHPGKPKNPAEPGLEELLERAKPFL